MLLKPKDKRRIVRLLAERGMTIQEWYAARKREDYEWWSHSDLMDELMDLLMDPKGFRLDEVWKFAESLLDEEGATIEKLFGTGEQ